jgi:dTDP-4-dehydrorhamnose reductase
MKLLITGASGLYGSKLAQLAINKNHQVYAVHNQHETTYGISVQLDISNQNQVERVFKTVNPDVVVHAATLTDVDKCELNKELAWKINVEGTNNIAIATEKNKTFLMHISTDYVFDGEKGCYKETDVPAPINYYGLTKLKAEERVRSIMSDYCISRTSVLYGAAPSAGKVNFALWLLNKLKNKEPATIVTDQWNSPTLNTSLAEMTLEIIERKLTGVFHLSGATRLSRYDFANHIAKVFSLNDKLIIPCVSSDFSWPARRPKDSSLDTTKAQQILKNKALQIDQALVRMKEEMQPLP